MSWEEGDVKISNRRTSTRSWINRETDEIAYIVSMSGGHLGIGKDDISELVKEDSIPNKIRDTLNLDKIGGFKLSNLEFDKVLTRDEIEEDVKENETMEEYGYRKAESMYGL